MDGHQVRYGGFQFDAKLCVDVQMCGLVRGEDQQDFKTTHMPQKSLARGFGSGPRCGAGKCIEAHLGYSVRG